MEQLLTTKLYIPPTRLKLVPRPRLTERLNEGIHRKLTLISAPAGFGKTTLVTEWLDSLRLDAEKDIQIENRIAWLSLDESDNDPARFLTYFITALNRGEGEDATFGKVALNMLQSPQPPPMETILTSLINEIAAISVRIILVLDDYHLIETQPIHDAFTYLLDHLPPQLHLVIATREDPHLPLARLRSQDQLTELRAADLRFTTAESAEFLNQVMGLDLSEEDIAALERRTEGWIAGLQLAAISMQGHTDTSRLIRSFTGSNRLVLDYLIEEVLEQQPESVQSFLLKTAILERLNGSLCDALTDQEDGQQTLEKLERSNLFIVPMDDERRWYRYHHLFADLMRGRLLQDHQEQIPSLHRKASNWFDEHGFIDESIEHTLLEENFERAAFLIEENYDEIYGRGELIKLQRWVDVLPEELVLTRPYLNILHAANLVSIGQLDEADRFLRIIEGILESKSDTEIKASPTEMRLLTESDRQMLIGKATIARCYLASYRGDLDETIRLAKLALDYLPNSAYDWRWSAVLALGDSYSIKGDMPSTYEIQSQALEMSRSETDIYTVITSSLKLATTLRMQGKLQQVQTICHQEMNRAIENGIAHLDVAGWLLALWGETLAEVNQLDEAYQKAKDGIKLAGSSTNVLYLGLTNLLYIRIIFSRGDLAGAEEVIQKLEKTNLESNIPFWILNQLSAWKARIWLSQGKLYDVSLWAKERWLDPDGLPSDLQEMEQIIIARFLFAQGRLAEMSNLLKQLLILAEAGGRISRVIEILLLQALSFQAQGNTDQAITSVEQALTLAEPGGFIRIFVDEGPHMVSLLYEALKRGIAPDYVQRLLAAFPTEGKEKTTALKSQDPESEWIEPLSEREIDVLHLLAEGLTNQEIALKLHVSLNTVKAHTRNIYSKIGVNNRTHAVAKARTLGILPYIQLP
ncbi:LuxR C-terminal-related transcriptional regulator [Chloroflexota bacterium]